MSKKIIILILIVIAIIIGGIFIYQRLKDNSIIKEEKIYKIGVLQNTATLNIAYTGFKEKMEELGHKEGDNVSYEYFDTKGDLAAGKEEAERFVKADIDLIYAIGIIPARAAKEITLGTKVPVVFAVVSDPVGSGLVNSLQTSGTNIAGVTPANQETSGKRVEFLKEIKPDLKRIIFPYNDPQTTGLDNIKRTARNLAIEVVDKYVANAEELDAFLNTFNFQKTDAILRSADSIISANSIQLIESAKKNKIPLSGTNAADVKNGALMSYGANYGLLGKQAAVIADKIFKGADPASFSVEFPEKFELAVNKKTAEIIGLLFSPDFLAKADLIVEQ